MNRSISVVSSVVISSLFLLPRAFAASPEPDPAAGKAAYEQACARCHGATGAGDGLDAKRLYPQPRKLTLGVYKFRSTASGTPPTDEDIFRTLTNGLPGTRMPSWGQLDEATRWHVVAYLKTLAPNFHDIPPQPIELTPDPGSTHADLAKGAQLYKDLGCVQCHGAAGRGNGPSAATLVDDWGEPIQAADLTQGWNYRGGEAPRDIALRLLTGIDGTPMPSYVDALADPLDAWQLAYYIKSLQPEPRWQDHLQAMRVKELPPDMTHERWERAPRTDVRLGGTVYLDGTVAPTHINALSIQALHDGETLALRLTWHDRSESRESLPDAVAVVLRPDALRGDVVSLQAWPLPEAPALDTIVWSAAIGQTVEAVDFDFASTGAQRPSTSTYDDGQWTVVLQRALQPADLAGAVALTQEHPVPIAFAAWDGGNQEQDRKRAVSYWINLQLQQ